jgi:exopolyphosphatase/guanosine-5'-triphosphate,3'-diphosphate pyrophosphatase
MRAVIDLGTNTFHLLIADLEAACIDEVLQLQIPVKIGSGGINKGFITPEAWARGMAAIEIFAEQIAAYKVKRTIAIGTSAIRNASNGKDFLAEIYKRFGIEVGSIDGKREAELIYRGVQHSFPFPAQPVWVMDIGGGSVEFILGQQNKIIWKQSFEIGAARLIDKFPLSNPATAQELAALNGYILQILEPVWQQQAIYQSPYLIGAAGSFDTLREVLTEDLNQAPALLSKHASSIGLNQAALFSNLIQNSTIAQRTQLKGLVDFRVDMIVAATCLMQIALDNLGSTQIIASHYALKEGILLSY